MNRFQQNEFDEILLGNLMFGCCIIYDVESLNLCMALEKWLEHIFLFEMERSQHVYQFSGWAIINNILSQYFNKSLFVQKFPVGGKVRQLCVVSSSN